MVIILHSKFLRTAVSLNTQEGSPKINPANS